MTTREWMIQLDTPILNKYFNCQPHVMRYLWCGYFNSNSQLYARFVATRHRPFLDVSTT